MVCQWMVQTNVFQHHFCSWIIIFFPNWIKDVVSSIKTLPALSKRYVQGSQWLSELQRQSAGWYGTTGGKHFSSVKPLIPFSWRLVHCTFNFATVFIQQFLHLPFFLGHVGCCVHGTTASQRGGIHLLGMSLLSCFCDCIWDKGYLLEQLFSSLD